MFRSILSKLVITICIVICAGLIAFLALPFIIDLFILPPLLEKTPFSSPQASISRLTPHELSGSVELEQQEKPSISIPRFKLSFSPGSLLDKKIDSLELTNAVFHLYRDGDRWLLPGSAGQSTKSSSSSSDNLYLLPYGVDTLILKRCRIVLHDGPDREIHVGINAQIEPEFPDTEEGRLLTSIQGSLQLFDDINAAVSFGIAFNDDNIHINAHLENASILIPAENLDSLPDKLKSFNFKALSALIEADLTADDFTVNRYKLTGELAGASYKIGPVEIGNNGSNADVTFAFSGSADEHTYEIASIPISAPIDAEMNVSGRAAYRDGFLRTTGEIRSFLFPDGDPDDLRIPVSLQYLAEWSQEIGYHVTAEGDYRSIQPVSLMNNALTMSLDNLQFSGTVDGSADETRAHLEVKSAPLTADYDNNAVKTSAVDLAVTALLIENDFAARLSGSIASVELPGSNLELNDIRFSLPYGTTPAITDKGFGDGSIAVDSIRFNKEPLVALSASLTQKNTLYTSSGEINGLFNPDMRITFDAEASPVVKSGQLDWNLIPTDITPESLPTQISVPIDFDFSGVTAASGTIIFDNFDVSASMRTSITDASMELSDSGLSIDAINCAVEFPQLPNISSSPTQRCSTGSIDLASLHFDHADLYFRVEDDQSLFIEKARLGWCEGRLDAASLRLSADNPEIDTTLYCSRIKLGNLLEQIGFKGTEGEGAVNGMLPIRLSKTSLEFDDGFLFSTPGTGGIVRFTDTELLRQGMGAVSQTGYINYSLAALEDFTYNWTKLSFDSSEDDLLLALELDGKPTTPLPFKFDKKGMIVESSIEEGLQYPIRLDVNFRLPLTELFQIGQSINSLMGNSQ